MMAGGAVPAAGWVRHYDFRLGDRLVGNVLEVEQATAFLAVARFTLDGEVVENRFRVVLDEGRPIRTRRGDDAWREVPEEAIPSCLYPQVLRSGRDSWQSFDEGSGEVAARRMEPRDGWVVEVDVATGADQRRFRIDDGEVAVIDWGGGRATSHLLDVEPINAP